MSRLLLYVVLASFSPGVASAQSLTAADLAAHCSAGDASDGKTICILMVRGFMDGFIEGVGKGTLDVYTRDAKVLAVFGSTPMRELMPHIQQVTEKATCLQRVSVNQLWADLVKYVRANSSIAERSYREGLTRTIIANYCDK